MLLRSPADSRPNASHWLDDWRPAQGIPPVGIFRTPVQLIPAGESELVDATPEVNAFDDVDHSCPIKYGTQDHTISCTGGLPPDYNNSLKFTREWLYFARVTYGVRLIYELLSVSVAGSHGHQFERKSGDPSNTLGQLSFSLGLDF